MQWFNLHLPILKSELFAEAEPWEIGVWLRLVTYCIEQENGGSIMGCNEWSDRKWLLAAGVEKADILRGSKLWTWAEIKPGVLWVSHYPNSREEVVRKARYAAMKGGIRKSERKTEAARENGKKGGRPPKTQAKPNNKIREGKVIAVSFDNPELEPEPDSGLR